MGMLLRPMFEQMQGGITQAAVPGFHFDSFEGTYAPMYLY
jgi:hypothetical protein